MCAQTLAICRDLPKAQRQALYKRLRHALRPQADGVEVVLEALRALATTHRSKAIPRAGLGHMTVALPQVSCCMARLSPAEYS